MTIHMSVGVAALVATAGAAFATPINYGNYSGPTVTYLQVTEDSTTDPTPLFGTPTLVGDSLNFNPVSFGSTAANGSSDITDGTLTTTMVAAPGYNIPAINFTENGDYTLAGMGGAGTSATVALAVHIDVLAINGAPITPVGFSANGTFSPLNGQFTLANPGPTFGLQSWSGGGTFNIDGFLSANSISGHATSVLVTIDNTLVTTSEIGTLAFIKKKQIGGVAITVVPTPGAAALLGLGGLVATRRRR